MKLVSIVIQCMLYCLPEEKDNGEPGNLEKNHYTLYDYCNLTGSAMKMELPGIIYPPNRPLERSIKPSQLPVLYDFLFFIESNINGEIILGCSDVAGTYWGGTLFHYANFELAETNTFKSYFISDSTTSDAKFIKDNYVLLAEDSGFLKLLMLPSDDTEQQLECKENFDKVDRITQLTVWNSNKFAVCTEKYIGLYDILNGSSIQLNRIFKNYHTDSIFSIDANKMDDHLCISSSADRKACIWDTRMEVPAIVIYNNEFSPLTSAAWNQKNDEYVTVGSEAGDTYLLSIKKPKDVVHSTRCFDSSIHKQCFNSSGQLAICGNTSSVLIYDCQSDQLTRCYENTEKDTVIRGLSWYKDNLYSCGFNRMLASYCC